MNSKRRFLSWKRRHNNSEMHCRKQRRERQRKKRPTSIIPKRTRTYEFSMSIRSKLTRRSYNNLTSNFTSWSYQARRSFTRMTSCGGRAKSNLKPSSTWRR
jgi:hypothetical protein